MAARVEITPEALEQLGKLSAAIVRRFESIIKRLAQWPQVSGAKPLRGDWAGHWRIRTGDFRIIFRLRGDVVMW